MNFRYYVESMSDLGHSMAIIKDTDDLSRSIVSNSKDIESMKSFRKNFWKKYNQIKDILNVTPEDNISMYSLSQIQSLGLY